MVSASKRILFSCKQTRYLLSLINIYFPQASEQTIILSTDTEIDGYYYSAMKDSVGDEYTLVYDETFKREIAFCE